MKRGKFDVPTAVGWSSNRTGARTQYGIVRWYWSSLDVKVKKPHKGCGPDCNCWKKEQA